LELNYKKNKFKMKTLPEINWNDFMKVEIRTGTVRTAERFSEARKPAYKMTIDFGKYGVRKTSAQLTTHYQAAELIGKQVLAVLNFPPKQIATLMSECLVLGAVDEDGAVTLLQTERQTENGLRVG
jgi:tRNA-binding protein